MKKNYLLLIALLLTGCNNANEESSIVESSQTSKSTSQESSSKESSSQEESTSKIESSIEKKETSMIENLEYEMFLDVSDFNMFINQTYYLKDILDVNSNIEVKSSNENIVEVKDNYLVAKQEGEATIYFILNGFYQDIKVTVASVDNDATTFAFNYGNLYGKKIVSFGDSVTADATIGCAKTYPNLFKENFEMSYVKNYAIGGTTATYMYENSNIWKEYHSNDTAIDGCRVVKNAIANNEIADVDYAFIAFGHNDQYFQPPIDSKDDENNLLSLENCVSFKASYRYMIRMLRTANPNIRIIILNCTYSEYDKSMTKNYGYSNTYDDYRNAIKEIATEFNCRYVDPWDYLKPYYANQRSTYYKDAVHLTIAGQELLFNYIIKN